MQDDNGRNHRLPTHKDVADLEQNQALVADLLPPFWWRLYNNSIESGFTEDQAFCLLQTYIQTGGVTGK